MFVKYLLYDSIVLIRKLIFKSKNCHGKFVYRKVFFSVFFFLLYTLDEEIRFAGNLFWISFTLFRVVFFIIFRIMILSNQKNDANRKCEGIFVVDISFSKNIKLKICIDLYDLTSNHVTVKTFER